MQGDECKIHVHYTAAPVGAKQKWCAAAKSFVADLASEISLYIVQVQYRSRHVGQDNPHGLNVVTLRIRLQFN